LGLFAGEGIDTLIHCGDLTDVEMARALEGFRVICVLGNGDIASGEIRATILSQHPENYVGLTYTGRIGGVRIAATHGHVPGQVEELVRSGNYDYVFKGHSHQHEDERFGFTRLINPGALGGLHRDDRHICILDLETGKAKFLKIET
jgi:putative phosphoesterase